MSKGNDKNHDKEGLLNFIIHRNILVASYQGKYEKAQVYKGCRKGV